MPYSDPENKDWTVEQILLDPPQTVLDVGAGAGVYAELLCPRVAGIHMTALEPWLPYVWDFHLLTKYDAVSMRDVRVVEHFDYDLVIFGDVLEHMPKDDAVAVWEKVSKQAKRALISIPIIHFPQGEEHGNPYEVHVKDDWTVDEVLESFPGITNWRAFNVTGVFFADFAQK